MRVPDLSSRIALSFGGRAPRGGVSRGAMAVALLGTALISGTPASQAAATAELGGLPEITVTARFRSESLQATPLAITAVTGRTLELRGLDRLQDIGNVAPNVYMRTQGTQEGPTPAIGIRGVLTTDFSFSGEPGVAVYIDDNYFGTLLGSSLELLDLERVEVLRGPQGTLFGKNALGGAIRAVSKKPQGDNSGYVQATYGAYNRMDFKGAFDYALVEDKLFLRVTGLSKRRDGYQKIVDFTCDMIARGTPQLAGIGDGIGADGSAGLGFDGRVDQVAVGSAADNNFYLPLSKPGLNSDNGCLIGRAGGDNVHAGRAMLRFVGDTGLEVNINADYTDDNSEPQPDSLFYLPQGATTFTYQQAVSGTAPRQLGWVYNQKVPSQYAGTGTTFTDLNFGIPFDGRFLTGDPLKTYSTFADQVTGQVFPAKSAITSYGIAGTVDYDLAPMAHLKWSNSFRHYRSEFSDDRDHGPLNVSIVYTLAIHDQYTSELQFTGDSFGSRLHWTTGGFYYHDKTFWGGAPQLNDSNGNSSFTHHDTAKSTNYSGFFHLVFDITEELHLTGGLRYTDESKNYHFDHRPFVQPSDAQTSENRWDWKAGIDYDLSDDVLLYTQVATGFRSESFNVRIFTPEQLTVPLPTETLTSYEVGVKSDLFDNRMRLNVAAFYGDYGSRNFGSTATECAEQFPTPVYGSLGGGCPGADGVFGTADDHGGPPWFANINVPIKTYGVEVEMQASPIDGLQIDSTLGWNHASSSDKPNFVPGNKIQPKWNGSAGVQYEVPLGNEGTVTPRVDMFYQGSVNSGNAFTSAPTAFDIIGGHAWFNARLTYETPDKDWEAALSVTNLFNKFYYENYWGSGTGTGAFRTGAPARPREWAVTLKRNF
jgi:iron complex outermembrane recepter protein